MPLSRKLSAIAVATYAALRRSIEERSDVEMTSTDFFSPSGPRSFSMNSRTSRTRSPLSASTVTSASVLRMICARSVDLPPPAAAKIPIRCPSPQVRSQSIARTPSDIGFEMMRRSSGDGGSEYTG